MMYYMLPIAAHTISISFSILNLDKAKTEAAHTAHSYVALVVKI